MPEPDQPSLEHLDAALRALADRLGRVRQALDQGPVALDQPLAELDRLRASLGHLPPGHGRRLRGAMIALLDEASALHTALARQREVLGASLRRQDASRVAGAAYRRARHG